MTQFNLFTKYGIRRLNPNPFKAPVLANLLDNYKLCENYSRINNLQEFSKQKKRILKDSRNT
jgi:hypothetical protein